MAYGNKKSSKRGTNANVNENGKPYMGLDRKMKHMTSKNGGGHVGLGTAGAANKG